MINATNESVGGNYTPVPTGTHVMRCYKMIEIGTVTGSFQGQPIVQKKVWIEWELPLETKVFKEGDTAKPFSIGKEFTLSLNEKAKLRSFLESWRGKAFSEEEAKSFDITKLIGVPCMGSVIEEKKKDKVFSNLSTVSTLMKGIECPPAFNKPVILSYDDFDFDMFNSIPKFIKEKMEKTPEFAKLTDKFMSNEEEKKVFQSNNNDDLPF